MTEQWRELKETIIELRDNDGTGTQQDVCKFLANLMNVLEKQMEGPKTGHWIRIDKTKVKCSKCEITHLIAQYPPGRIDYCPNCGVEMSEIPTGSESEG